MEITKEQWDELCNKLSGFETKIEELKTQNSTLTAKNSELETKSTEYEKKLAEWQTKLNDQQTTIDTLAATVKIGKGGADGANSNNPKSGHKSVRFDPAQDKYIFE